MSSAAASAPINAPSEQAAVNVFSKALGLSLQPRELNPGGLFRAVAGLFRNTWSRCAYAVVSTVGAVCSLSGLRSITAVNALIASLILGPEKALRLVGASVAVVAAVGWTRAIASAPSGGVYSQEFISKLSRDDRSTWGSLLQLIDTFDKVTKNMPVLEKPKIVTMRDENPPELFLRLLALVYQHQASQHHSPPPVEINTKSQPRSAAAVVRTDHYLVSSLRSLAKGEKGAAAAAKADCECAENSSSKVCGSAHQRQGTPAPTSLIHELRTWMEYAEATYYEMACEDRIEAWLKDRGWQLLVASLDNRPHSPVYYVAVHAQRKQLLVSVRGTESISDAACACSVEPVTWGDEDQKVHSGIGAAAEGLYSRLQHIATSFASSGHSVVLVGHSLGAGVVALLAWLLRERCGISELRAVAFATPACASQRICETCKDYVVSCVMRDDAVPRMSPRALVSLQEEALALTWGEMAECAHAWGALGRTLYDKAREGNTAQQRKLQDDTAQPSTPAASTPDADGAGPSTTSSSADPATQQDATTSKDASPPTTTTDYDSSSQSQPRPGSTTPVPGASAPAVFSSQNSNASHTDVFSTPSHPISSLSDSPMLSSTADFGVSPVNQPSPLRAPEVVSQDAALMVPFVPGTIVFLHPMETHPMVQYQETRSADAPAQQPQKPPSAAETSDESPSAATSLLQREQDHCDTDPDTDIGGQSSNTADSASNTAEGGSEGGKVVPKPAAEVDGGPMRFERFVIRADAMTLGTLRIHQQGLNDHFLDQYRSGLGMRTLPYST